MTCRETRGRARTEATAWLVCVVLLVCVAISLALPPIARANESWPVDSRTLPHGWTTVSESSVEGRYASAQTNESRGYASAIVRFLDSSYRVVPNSSFDNLTAPSSFAEFEAMCESHSSMRYPDSEVSRRAEQTSLSGQPIWRYSTSLESPYGSNTETMIFNPSNGGGTWVFVSYNTAFVDGRELSGAAGLKSQVSNFLNSLRFKQARSTDVSASMSGPWDSRLPASEKALYWLLTKTPLALVPQQDFDQWAFIFGSIASFLAAASAIAGIALSFALQHGRKVSPHTPVGFALHVSSRRVRVGRDEHSVFTAKAWRVLASGTPQAATDVTVSIEAPAGVSATPANGEGTLRTTLQLIGELAAPAHLIVTATAPTGGTQTAIAIEAE